MQDEVSQEESEHNEVDGIKKGVNSKNKAQGSVKFIEVNVLLSLCIAEICDLAQAP